MGYYELHRGPRLPDGTRCPWCGEENDGHLRVGGSGYKAPEPGDVSLCFGCGRWAVYTDAEGGKRKVTADERATILRHPTGAAAEAAWLTARSQP